MEAYARVMGGLSIGLMTFWSLWSFHSVGSIGRVNKCCGGAGGAEFRCSSVQSYLFNAFHNSYVTQPLSGDQEVSGPSGEADSVYK